MSAQPKKAKVLTKYSTQLSKWSFNSEPCRTLTVECKLEMEMMKMVSTPTQSAKMRVDVVEEKRRSE